jgi:hypothetical protein
MTIETPLSDSSKPAQGLSRRHALAGLAVLPAAASLPIAAAAEQDPIFTAIERHRQTDIVKRAKEAEANRFSKLADEMVGPSDIEIESKTEPGTIVKACCWLHIQEAVPQEKFPELYEHYNALLEERRAARRAVNGRYESDEWGQAEYDANMDALQAFAETIPTTQAGLLAMLIYSQEVRDANWPDILSDCGVSDRIVETLATAAKALGTRLA